MQVREYRDITKFAQFSCTRILGVLQLSHVTVLHTEHSYEPTCNIKWYLIAWLGILKSGYKIMKCNTCLRAPSFMWLETIV